MCLYGVVNLVMYKNTTNCLHWSVSQMWKLSLRPLQTYISLQMMDWFIFVEILPEKWSGRIVREESQKISDPQLIGTYLIFDSITSYDIYNWCFYDKSLCAGLSNGRCFKFRWNNLIENWISRLFRILWPNIEFDI